MNSNNRKLLNNIWAVMLNNGAKKDSQRVLESLEIKSGDIVADIGSGGGYFAFALAKRTGPDGKVFAVDTNKALLTRIEKAAKKKQILNIGTITSNEEGSNLPEESCDLIFMRNVFHHIKAPVSYFHKLRESIKPDGRIAVIDWKSSRRGHAGHTAPESEILRIMREAGFTHLISYDFLDNQSFNIFQRG